MRVLDMYLVIVAVICGHQSLASGQLAVNPCMQKMSCSECLAASKHCGWCQSVTFPVFSPRCDHAEALGSAGCHITNIVSPQNSMTTHNSPPFTNSSLVASPGVTITPRRIRVKLRAGSSISIPLQVKIMPRDVRRRYLKLKPRLSSKVNVTISSQCPGFQRRRRWVKCPGQLQENKIIAFEVKLTLMECFPPSERQNIRVSALGMSGRTFMARVTGLCRCQCEDDTPVSSSSCTGHGALSCGACLCSPGYYGPQCQCQGENAEPCMNSTRKLFCYERGLCEWCICACNTSSGRGEDSGRNCQCHDESCGYHNGLVCGGVGQCVCGQCVCFAGFHGTACEHSISMARCRDSTGVICNNIGTCLAGACTCPAHHYGQFCECSDLTCERHNGLVCAGPENGRCVCGRCLCRPGFSGNACHLSTSLEPCRASNQEICNGHGQCINRRCLCDSPYRGDTCEDCPACVSMCMELKDCVLCRVFHTGPLDEQQCLSTCASIELNVVHILGDPVTGNRCSFADSTDGRYFFFSYQQMNSRMHVTAQRNKVLPGR